MFGVTVTITYMPCLAHIIMFLITFLFGKIPFSLHKWGVYLKYLQYNYANGLLIRVLWNVRLSPQGQYKPVFQDCSPRAVGFIGNVLVSVGSGSTINLPFSPTHS